MSDFFLKEDSILYDCGTSLGDILQKIAKRHPKKGQLIGIDSESAMIAKANKNNKQENIEFVCDDITTYSFLKSDIIISYYTVQFIHPKHRQGVLNAIYNALNWGGAFIFFEKVRGEDARFQDIYTTMYHDYKLEKGAYSPDEIMSKSRSLKGVLEPFSSQGNMDLLKRAGFVDITTVFKCLCFQGFLAIK